MVALIISAYICVIGVLVTHFPEFVLAVPQIFNEVYSSCEYEFNGGKKVVFTDKLWTINRNQYNIYFSLCKSVQSKCKNKTSSCMVRRRNNEVIDLGHEFIEVDSEDFILRSVNGARCPNSSKNYTLTINFECSNTIKANPRLMTIDEDDCGFEISMMKPDCQPKCTDHISGAYLIDIRNFPKNIDVETDDSKKFCFTLCGLSRKCGSRDISGCEILNNIIPLAATDSQSVVYDIDKNELTARGRYKQGRVIREIEVLIKCNWETEIRNAKYIKVADQGKRYRFELESSFGCVKLPQNCIVQGIDNLKYNLSNLYKPDGWEVSNVPEGRILLNICGPLNKRQNLCSDQYSQVCHVNGKKHTNRGTTLLPLKVNDNVIKAVFLSGSICEENTQKLYSTEIDFKCSKIEKGPVFKHYGQCITTLSWETPHACAIDYYKGQNCYMNDRLGNRNLQALYATNDSVYILSSDNRVKLVYNLCGSLHGTCNGFDNVSFCLHTQGNNEVVIGWDNREVISENGLLRMEFSGNQCLNKRTNGKVTVNLICNYEVPSPPSQIIIVEDGCTFNMTVFTPLACLSKNNFKNCVYNIGDACYNLSSLSHKDKNHVIRTDQNVEYIFNLCGPIVNGPGAMCRPNTMSCLRNKTEVNIKYQYTSLGGVSSPRFHNNSLVIEAKMGAYCQGFGYYKSVFYFECSQRKFPPKILSKEPCTYNFIWKTPEACAQNRSCVITGSHSDMVLDLTNLYKKTLKINVDNELEKYEFHLCRDEYARYINDVRSVGSLKREFYNENKKKYLILDLEQNCDNSSVISKVVFEIECYQTKDYFEKKSFENCILNMIIRTPIICSTKKEENFYSVLNEEFKENSTTSLLQNKESASTPKRTKKRDCSLISEKTGHEYNLTKIGSKEISFGNDHYCLNFDGKLKNCDGIICKNSMRIAAADVCPVNSFNDNSVELYYSTQNPCNSNHFYQLLVLLKCGSEKTNEKLIENDICQLIIEYTLPEVCPLFYKASVPKATIVGGVIGGLFFLCIILVLIYIIRRRCTTRIPYISSKAAVPVYFRNCRN